MLAIMVRVNVVCEFYNDTKGGAERGFRIGNYLQPYVIDTVGDQVIQGDRFITMIIPESAVTPFGSGSYNSDFGRGFLAFDVGLPSEVVFTVEDANFFTNSPRRTVIFGVGPTSSASLDITIVS